LRPKDLRAPRDRFRVLCENADSRVWRTTLATATREVKAAQSSVKLGRIGLFIVLLGRFSTGSSFSAPDCHDIHRLDHFKPLCTTILALSRLLSSRNLMVAVPLLHWFGKIRRLVV